MTTKFKPQAVFFDLDGTLLDTAHDILLALNTVLARYQQPLVEYQELLKCISKGAKAIIRDLLGLNLDDSNLEKLRVEFIDAYHTQGHTQTKYFPGILETILLLNKNNIPWGIITNKTSKLTLPMDPLFNFTKLQCKSLVCADTTAFCKPHAAPMLKACEDANVSPANCVFIGDARTDIEAGKNVGMKTIVASYGYIPPDEDMYSWEADYIIKSGYELVELFGIKHS